MLSIDIYIYEGGENVPDISGGDQGDHCYAPHLYIGEFLVGNDQETIEMNKWTYRIGKTNDGTMVCERWRKNCSHSNEQHELEIVLYNNLPKKVKIIAENM